MASQIRYLERTIASFRDLIHDLENQLAEKEERLTAITEELKAMQTRIGELISEVEVQRDVSSSRLEMIPTLS